MSTAIPLPPVAEPAALYDRRHGAACALTSLVIGLGQSLAIWGVNNNLPALQGALGATAAEASWLSTAYFATALSAIVPLTKLRLQFGIERFAIWGIALFAAVTLWYVVAPGLGTAIAARAALGLAATPLSTLAVFYMIQAVPAPLAPVGAVLGFGTLQLGSPLARVVAQPLFDAAPGMGVPVFDLAVALLGVAAITAVPLRGQPRRKVLNAGDLPAFVLYATGLALLCIVVTQGRIRWWTDTPWLGTCLWLGIVCLGAYVVFDLWRDEPLVDLRWLAGPTMRWLVLAVLLFRIGLSEQTTGAVGLMNALGLTNDDMRVLFAWVTLGIVAGFGVVVVALALRWVRPALLLSLGLITTGALMDATATSLTRPHDILASQILIAVATAIFLGSTFALGLLPVFQDGQRNIVSFLAMFVGAQNMGSLVGSAWLGTYVADQQSGHVARLIETLTLADPQVVTRATQNAAAHAATIVDPLLRGVVGVSTLAQQVISQAGVLAYGDFFRRIAVVPALTFVWLAVYWTVSWWRQRGVAVAQPASGALP